jgi:hypothetical protein
MTRPSLRCAVATALFLAAPVAGACDLCSVYTASMAHGETGGAYAGIATQFTRYDELREEGHRVHDDGGQYLDSAITQAFIGYGFGPRLNLQLTVPWIHRSWERPEHEGVDKGSESGIGDISAIAQYTLLRRDTEDHTLVWRVLGGIEFGTGDTDRLTEELEEGHADAHGAALAGPKHGGSHSGIHGHDLAFGSGSTDFLVGTSAFWRSGRWYGSGDLRYSIRREGDFDYRFGNDLQLDLAAGRFLVLEHDRTVSLQLNLAGEDKDYDELAGMRLDDTRMRTWFAGPQLGLTFGPRVALEFRIETPVSVDNSALQTTAGWRARAAFVSRF